MWIQGQYEAMKVGVLPLIMADVEIILPLVKAVIAIKKCGCLDKTLEKMFDEPVRVSSKQISDIFGHIPACLVLISREKQKEVI